MESKKCLGPTNLNQNSGLRVKFESNLWDSGTFLTACVRGLRWLDFSDFTRTCISISTSVADFHQAYFILFSGSVCNHPYPSDFSSTSLTSVTGNFYKVINDDLWTRDEAKDLCQATPGADLATFNTEDEAMEFLSLPSETFF